MTCKQNKSTKLQISSALWQRAGSFPQQFDTLVLTDTYWLLYTDLYCNISAHELALFFSYVGAFLYIKSKT